MAVPMPRRLFTVDEYERMGEAGILGEDDRVELIAGEIVEMSPIGSRHFAKVTRFIEPLVLQLRGRALVTVQNPVRLGSHWEPVPDLLVLRTRDDDYEEALPTAADVLILIEVADSSRDSDRRVKLPQYARAGIPEVWFTDLTTDTIERHTDPGEDGYRLVSQFRRGQILTSVVLPTLSIPVDAIFR